MTLLEHLTGWNAGIDTLLFDEPPGALATAAPGRMGPPASLSFLALGTAIALLTGGVRARGAAVALALLVLAVAMLSLTGYSYEAEVMYTVAHVSGIAAQTATIIAALAIAVITADPQRQPIRTLAEEGIAGTLARRLLPLVIALPLVLGWLRLFGEDLGLYDPAFGSALRTLIEVTLLSAFVWWSMQAIRDRDLQRRRAEQELRDSRHRLSRTLASITDGFVAFDRDWRFTYVNEEAEALAAAAACGADRTRSVCPRKRSSSTGTP